MLIYDDGAVVLNRRLKEVSGHHLSCVEPPAGNIKAIQHSQTSNLTRISSELLPSITNWIECFKVVLQDPIKKKLNNE